MPTIELISIGCPKIPELPRYDSFAYTAETELRSHGALFQSVFDTLTGVVVHLANKDMEGHEDGPWFAGKIMDWQGGGTITPPPFGVGFDEEIMEDQDDTALVFLPETLLDVRDLMQRLLAASPEKRILFSTDYQFGSNRRECGEIAFSRCFDLHAQHKLRYNHLRYLRADG